MKSLTALTHAAGKRAGGRKLGKGHRTVDELLAAGKTRGRKHARSPKAIEAKLAAARAQLRVARN